MTTVKHVYAKFQGPEIFLEQGRLLYSILHAFSQSGFRVTLFDNQQEWAQSKYGRMVTGIKNLELSRDPPRAPNEAFFLFDDPDRNLAKLRWAKRLEVRFDLFSRFWFGTVFIMPFPMHPLQSNVTTDDLARWRSSARNMRVFFSGDTEGYRRVWIRHPHPKLPRLQVVEALVRDLGCDLVLIHDALSLDAHHEQPWADKCVLTASNAVWIAPQDWLPTLASADFFLSPPGIVMPMCHNIIEAMAVGTIPITNYPEWLDPPLRNMQECLVFDGEKDLLSKIKMALEMDQAQIAEMRTRVLEYYDKYLRPQSFVQRIQSTPKRNIAVLMHTERYVARNARKLSGRSILLKGSTNNDKKNWLKNFALWPSRR